MAITTSAIRGVNSDTKVTENHSPAPAGGWHRARVSSITHSTLQGVCLRLDVPNRVTHLPGQHYVVRLTASDGYVAQRSYSLASAPSDPLCELFVERLDGGEVSSYLCDEVIVGDEFDVRGPIGGWFVWNGSGLAVGIAGGTGVVPLIAMLRHAADIKRTDALDLVVSSRTLSELPYADELLACGAFIALSREVGADGRPAGRLTAAEVGPRLVDDATYYICGSNGFAESVSDILIGANVHPEAIRVERFGPTGQ
jgi:ferredoxin-NADP reductase